MWKHPTCLVEVSIFGSGAWADRMISDIPTWALGAGVLVAMGIAAGLFLRIKKVDAIA